MISMSPVQQEDFALLAAEPGEGGGQPRFQVRVRRVRGGRGRRGRGRQLGVALEDTLLGPPVIAQQVHRDPVQPRAERGVVGPVGPAPPVGRRERVRGQVVGEVRANPPGDEAVHRGEVRSERGLEPRVVRDAGDAGGRRRAGHRSHAVHTCILSADRRSVPARWEFFCARALDFPDLGSQVPRRVPSWP
jgi:hypothetical protein